MLSAFHVPLLLVILVSHVPPLALGAQVRGATPLDSAPVVQSPATRQRVVLDWILRRELLAQRGSWQAEEDRVHGVLRHPQYMEPGKQRLSMLHCHTDRLYNPSPPRPPVASSRPRAPGGVAAPPEPEVPGKPYPLPVMIESAAFKTAMCPNWLVMDADHDVLKMPQHLKVSSAPAQRTPFSDSVIARLDSAAVLFPDDPWYTRQLVRVRTENGELPRAAATVRRCRPQTVTWCAVLDVYVQYVAGQWEVADSAYRSVMSRLDPDTRCFMRSAVLLLPPSDAAPYRQLPCAVRDSMDATLWWLATPFFADGINLRALEHFARVVRNSLVSDLSLDAHHDLRVKVGGDAIAAMRTRYGWPQHMFWAGDEQEKAHTHYQGASNAPPFPAAEYSRLNSPTLATWRAVQSPFTLTDADYDSHPPDEFSSETWLPQEFFLHPRGSIARLSHTQHVVLRRDSSALIVVAADLRSDRRDQAAAVPGDALLIHSPGPGSAQLLDHRTAQPGERVLLQGFVRDAGVVSVEYLLPRASTSGARSRFGVPADPMRPLTANGCAISQPMLLSANAVKRRGLVDIEEGLLGTLQLSKSQKVGVAWESYGFRQRDTVNIGVRITGAATLNSLQRAGRFFGVGDDPRVGITMSWREPNPAHIVMALEAQTPTLLRELLLDLSKLRTGAYQVEVTMERRGCPAVRSQRAFSVVR